MMEIDLKNIRKGDHIEIGRKTIPDHGSVAQHSGEVRVQHVSEEEIIVEGRWVFSRTQGDSLTPPYSYVIESSGR